MQYHYTDAASAADILRDGKINAYPQTLHKAIDASDRGLDLAPLVWLSTNPILDGTIAMKLLGAGHMTLEGRLCRFVLPHDFCDVGLGDYVDLKGIDPDWCEMIVRTGHLANSDYSTWRLHDGDIEISKWLRVERFVGVDKFGEKTLWEQF